MGRLVVFITATTIMIIEGYPMVAERFLKNRYNEGKAEGFKEGYEKAKEELAKEKANNNPPAQQPSEESPKQ
jgi:flagellar biosynthesis/type III secretory pathway protein FliH